MEFCCPPQVRADRDYELLEEQVEQLTLALGHTARQKADAEAKIRLLEQVSRVAALNPGFGLFKLWGRGTAFISRSGLVKQVS